MSAVKATRYGAHSVSLVIAGGDWTVVTDSAGVTVNVSDRVGLVEKLLDALTDDERAGVREYLGGAS